MRVRRQDARKPRSRSTRSWTASHRARPARRSAGRGCWRPSGAVAAPPRSTRGRGCAEARHRTGRHRAATAARARRCTRVCWTASSARSTSRRILNAIAISRSPTARARSANASSSPRRARSTSARCTRPPPSWRPTWTLQPQMSRREAGWFDIRSGRMRGRPRSGCEGRRAGRCAGRPRRPARGSGRASRRGPRAGSRCRRSRCRPGRRAADWTSAEARASISPNENCASDQRPRLVSVPLTSAVIARSKPLPAPGVGQLVGRDQPRPERAREVLALGRPEPDDGLLALEVAGRPVVEDRVAADRFLGPLGRQVARRACRPAPPPPARNRAPATPPATRSGRPGRAPRRRC